MNRLLLVPAMVCFAAFSAAYMRFSTAQGGPLAKSSPERRIVERDQNSADTSGPDRSARAAASQESAAAAEAVLSAFRDAYLKRVKASDFAPHHAFSRAAIHVPSPKMVDVVYHVTTVESAATAEDPSVMQPLALATITIRSDLQPGLIIPAVVSTADHQLRLFANGRWQSSDAWLNKAVPGFAPGGNKQ